MVDYKNLSRTISSLTKGETDKISLMATIACEIHHSDNRFDWTGFYRVVSPNMLKIGPYQGKHGCLSIPFSRGVCGLAASTGKFQLVSNVAEFSDHIACSSSTQSELVIPFWDGDKNLLGVFDIDSDCLDAFTIRDAENLNNILCRVFS
ncbi:MAG: GAF domain-containing protein [Proteobacteria bacterium]|jgi:L-methionine (R)-S-oxide reductase|nr:GAF domain-containing protein [Pseudomonadota bacterium]